MTAASEQAENFQICDHTPPELSPVTPPSSCNSSICDSTSEDRHVHFSEQVRVRIVERTNNQWWTREDQRKAIITKIADTRAAIYDTNYRTALKDALWLVQNDQDANLRIIDLSAILDTFRGCERTSIARLVTLANLDRSLYDPRKHPKVGVTSVVRFQRNLKDFTDDERATILASHYQQYTESAAKFAALVASSGLNETLE